MASLWRVQLAPPWKKEEHTVNFHSVGRRFTVTDGECRLSRLNPRRPESLKGHQGVKHFRGSAYITPQIAAIDGFFMASFCSDFPTWDLPFCPFRHCPDECCGLIFFFFPLRRDTEENNQHQEWACLCSPVELPSICFCCTCGGYRNVWALAWDFRHDCSRWEF